MAGGGFCGWWMVWLEHQNHTPDQQLDPRPPAKFARLMNNPG